MSLQPSISIEGSRLELQRTAREIGHRKHKPWKRLVQRGRHQQARSSRMAQFRPGVASSTNHKQRFSASWAERTHLVKRLLLRRGLQSQRQRLPLGAHLRRHILQYQLRSSSRRNWCSRARMSDACRADSTDLTGAIPVLPRFFLVPV